MTTLAIIGCAAVLLTWAADLWTTHRGLARGAREGNRVLAWFLAHGGFPALAVFKTAVTIGAVWLALVYAPDLTGLVAVLPGVAAWLNWRRGMA